nr:MAG TPA: putative tail fiber protein fold, Tail fiber, receptor [Caudoviricetes sp.]
MSYQDQRGHKVPSPTDPARRQDLLDLSLSIPSYKACASETAAAQYVAALAGVGLTASPSQPVYVWRTDLNAVRVWDGSRWAGESNLQMELGTSGDIPVGNRLSFGVRNGLIKAGKIATSAIEVQFGNLYFDYVKFQTPFPNDCISVTLTPLYGTGSDGWNFRNAQQFCLDLMTRTGFRAMLPGVTTTGRHAYAWTAIGY